MGSPTHDRLEEKLLEDEDQNSSDSDSSSSSSEEDEEERTEPFVQPAVVVTAPAASGSTAPAAQVAVAPVRDSQVEAQRRTGKQLWGKARVKVLVGMVRVKLGLHLLHADAKKTKRFNVGLAFGLVVFFAIMDTETKACAFHLSAVGRYSVDGKPYKFSYSLFVALAVFIIKLGLGPLERLMHKWKKAGKQAHRPSSHDVQDKMERKNSKLLRKPTHISHREKREFVMALRSTTGKNLKQIAMPWVLLLAFTFCEMMSTTLTNYALNLTPTSIFIVFKSSKMVFVALASRLFLGENLRWAQWSSLLLIVIALLIATVAEDKGGKKGGGMSLQGPIILLVSEMFHATMLVLQQIAVASYWPEPMLLVSWSAVMGIPITISCMIAAHKTRTPEPPYHPVSDPYDVFVMCSNSATLCVALLLLLVSKVGMDINHITALKHLSPLAKSLADAVKLGIMWAMGKIFYLIGALLYSTAWPEMHKTQDGTLAVFAEPWLPNSWLMIPGLMIISYAMLMFKFKVFLPIKFTKFEEDGKWHFELVQDTEDGSLEVGLDDGFYSAAFTDKKVKGLMKETLGRMLEERRAASKPVNKLQALVKGKNKDAFDKLRASNLPAKGEQP